MSKTKHQNEAACGGSALTAELERVAGRCGGRIMHTEDGHEVVCFRPDDLKRFAEKLPDVLFDGYAVLRALDEKARARTSAENISDVLDAVARLMRSNVKVQPRRSLASAGTPC